MIQPLSIRPIEYWKKLTPEIVGFEIRNGYWISTEGRLYSEFIKSVMHQCIDKDGYNIIGLYDVTGKQITLRVHRVVMLAFYPISNPLEMQVNHINGIKNMNDEENLEWATASENVKHAFRTGLHPIAAGEDNSMASISNDMALKIGELLSTEKYTYREISAITGCNTALISSIRTGNCWSFVCDKYNLKEKHIANSNATFTYYELHAICKYFQDNNIKELTRDIKEDILKLLNKESNYNTRKALKRIFYKERHQSISKDYKF